MKFLVYQTLGLALSGLQSTFAHPLIGNDGPYPIPIAHVPVSTVLNSAPGITPNIHLLNKTDLLTEGTIVPGSPGLEPIPTPATPQKRDIIGPDNRFLQSKTGNPWDYIGSFAWQVGNDGYRCSASLVGPRHLATARHCYNTTNSAITYNFRPNYDQGTRGYTTAQATDVMYIPGTLTDECSYGDDWIVMVLNQRIGDKYGYFGVKQFSNSEANQANFFHEGMYIYGLTLHLERLLTPAKAIPSISITRSVRMSNKV